MCVGCLGAYAVAYGLGDSRWRTSIGLTTLVAGPYSSCSLSVSCPPFLATVPRSRMQAAAAADSAAIARESALAHGSRLHALRRESPRRARPAYRGRHHRSCRGGQRRRRGVAADLRWPKRGIAASRREAGGARALAGTAAAGGRARRGDSARRDRRQHGVSHTDTTPGPNHARQQRAYTGTPGKTVSPANRKKVLYYSRDVLQLAGMGAAARPLLYHQTRLCTLLAMQRCPSHAFRPHPPAGDALLASSAAGLDRAGRAWGPHRPESCIGFE